MLIHKLEQFIKGWVIGNFEPNIIKTKDFEIAIKKYNSGDVESPHIHKIAREITVIVSGVFNMNNKIIKEGDIIDLESNKPSSFKCLETGYNVVIKIPSVKNDKYILE